MIFHVFVFRVIAFYNLARQTIALEVQRMKVTASIFSACVFILLTMHTTGLIYIQVYIYEATYVIRFAFFFYFYEAFRVYLKRRNYFPFFPL